MDIPIFPLPYYPEAVTMKMTNKEYDYDTLIKPAVGQGNESLT